MESPKISPQSQDNADVLEDSGCNLVLHNDDVHTFDYVIRSLVDISYETLLPMHTALLDKQLTSEIVQ